MFRVRTVFPKNRSDLKRRLSPCPPGNAARVVELLQHIVRWSSTHQLTTIREGGEPCIRDNAFSWCKLLHCPFSSQNPKDNSSHALNPDHNLRYNSLGPLVSYLTASDPMHHFSSSTRLNQERYRSLESAKMRRLITVNFPGFVGEWWNQRIVDWNVSVNKMDGV